MLALLAGTLPIQLGVPHRCKNRRSPISGRHAGSMVCAYGGGRALMRIWGKGVCSDVVCRVSFKDVALRLMAPRSRCDPQWYPRQRPTVGAGSLRFSQRFPRPPVHHMHASYRISPFPVVHSRIVMLVQEVFVATWRAASRLGPHRAPTPRRD